MYEDKKYVVQSLESHLFFARIMKEHALFLKAGFTPVNSGFADEAECFKKEFEKLLSCAVRLGDGIISCRTLESGEIVTEFTTLGELQTEHFTGIAIDEGITARELKLRCGENGHISRELCSKVCELNEKSLHLLDGLIAFKEKILDNVLHCCMFTTNYPLLIEHITNEAKRYYSYIQHLQDQGFINFDNPENTEEFWNNIMRQHALFIRGTLDPTEAELIETANEFAEVFAGFLAEENCHMQRHAINNKSEVLKETIKFRNFKADGAAGIEDCQIRSVILPLLADHVLREANHYIRLLEE